MATVDCLATAGCFTGDEGISDSVGGDDAGVDVDVDEILTRVQTVACDFDVEHRASSVAEWHRLLLRSGRPRDVEDSQRVGDCHGVRD